VWRILGSVAGLSAAPGLGGCGGEAAEANLREGLKGEGADLCRADESGFLQFSHVANLNPDGDYEYLEFRGGYFDDASIEEFAQQKEVVVEDPDLSLTEKETALEALLQATGVYSTEVEGECDYVAGCDRFFVPDVPGGFPDINGDTSYLFATGASGPAFVTNVEEAQEFLGAIDTPEEAAWIAYAEGYRPVCDGMSFLETDEGYELYVERGHTCGSDITGYRVRVTSAGVLEELDSRVVEEGDDNCVIGRLPSGQITPACSRRGEHPVGRYFADNARLEAASVIAFRELAAELEGHGAPPELVAWARRAADEELVHTKMCADLARRFGSEMGKVRVARAERRELFDIAKDNAVEGLTREAFGALLAHHQMLSAEDPEVRRVMRSIAHDEASHAEFSLSLDAWLSGRLSAEERRLVEEARLSAQAEFRASAERTHDDDLVRLAGVPKAAVATALFDALFAPDVAA
jgi:hypothetical protein